MTKHQQHSGRTQRGAAYRVDLARAIKKSGTAIKGSEHTTKDLETIYRSKVGGVLPRKKTREQLRQMSRW